MFVCSAAHGMTFAALAVLYSGWKLNGVPEQSAGDVEAKPFAADACIEPDWPVVRSVITTLKAWPPPGAGASNMCTVIRSPGLISSVWRFGV